MERAQCIEVIYPELEDKLVVTIMGACAQELYNLGHRENFFYLQHAMGLASSIGLGLAMHLPEERVVVMDGGRVGSDEPGDAHDPGPLPPEEPHPHHPSTNGSLLSTGGFDSQTTSGITDLAQIAKGAGVEHVATAETPLQFGEAVLEAFERDDLSVIVAKVLAVGPDEYGMDLELPENAFRFRRHIRERKQAAG